VTKIRQNLAVPMAALVTLAGSSALALQRWWLAPIMLVPIAVAWWGFRSGVDADTAGIRVRGLTGSRTVPWPDVSGFRIDRRRVLLTTTAGTELPLPAVTPADVPRLAEASGGSFEPAQ
jgi:hypothetical protein